MSLDSVDGYLLENRGTKADVIAGLLKERSDDAVAAPFYRALEILGARVADEALIALRLVLAGKAPEDDAVKRVRAHVAASRSNGPAAQEARVEYAREMA
ncbi:MAG: hypothetical protein M3126_04805 [Candidatus Eremiobacteraeota bacterium]|nr:hypothetical protein [Candidatus Eremiobacteraeota bacterium]